MVTVISFKFIMRRALIVIDMSVEQWANVSYRRASTLSAVQHVISQKDFFHLKVDSHLWIYNNEETSLWSVHPDVGHADTEGAKLIPELRKCKGADEMTFVEKKNYSAFPGNRLEKLLRKEQIDEVYLCGINTDFCVFATALDAFQMKFKVFVIEDAVTSIAGKAGHAEGLQRAINHFSRECLVLSKDLGSRQQ